MRCACCGRAINPKHAISGLNNSKFGPVCAQRLGLVSKAPTRSRKPSRFAIFSKTSPVRVEGGQIDIFGVMA